METNTLTDQPYRVSDLSGKVLSYDDPRLMGIVRLRYISDPGFPMWDFSYCWGLDADGDVVRVTPPAAVYQIPKRRPASAIIARWPELPSKIEGGYVKDVLSLNV